MKKTIIAVVTVLVAILILWIGLRATHILETYNIATSSNEPTYKPRDIIFASCLKKPDHGDFICFRQPNGSVWIFRCIAKGGDVVEIRDSKVYLNGKELNEPYANIEYYITNKQLDSIRGYIDQYHYEIKIQNDSLHTITFTEQDRKNYHLDLKRVTLPKGFVDQAIYGSFKLMKYNEDNLGPIKVPQDSYFVLGDDRRNAMDSRYLGFISRDDVISTVIN